MIVHTHEYADDDSLNFNRQSVAFSYHKSSKLSPEYTKVLHRSHIRQRALSPINDTNKRAMFSPLLKIPQIKMTKLKSKNDTLKLNEYIDADHYKSPLSPTNTNDYTVNTKVKPFEKIDDDAYLSKLSPIMLNDLSDTSDA
jgi:hypothetical protein